ncbi:hypothetical protein [Microvirga mediterraneensis]|uniref:Uncharacterized protein n=1 Tax=Microvirga mediterraneensis TaxID=2754695 RepID=A0A838BN54_9HYPH|nr:hypothetical protein [Microvirga mediterraneensis]MBA1157124.1 hypothetical protein [Microvirga mediterraneensis]
MNRTRFTEQCSIVGAVFYGLAGLQHVRNDKRARWETIDTASALFIAAIAILYLIAA